MIPFRLSRQIGAALLTASTAFFPSWAYAENAGNTPHLSLVQIVEQMQHHEKTQGEALEHYKAVRHYEVEYHGFFKTITAAMDVEVEYRASSGKTFRTVSETGSHPLCEKVLQRAVTSERDASQNAAKTALTAANYKFQLVGTDEADGHAAYVLDVVPLTPSKFLYTGRIWVDATDFAVVKLEVHPAKNPSFWISQTSIQHKNAKTAGFWLPQHNRSVTKVRIGGTAVMTIDYGTYQINTKESTPAIVDNSTSGNGDQPSIR
jgi:hypothetical protein